MIIDSTLTSELVFFTVVGMLINLILSLGICGCIACKYCPEKLGYMYENIVIPMVLISGIVFVTTIILMGFNL